MNIMEKIVCNGRLVLTLNSKAEWISRVPRHLPNPKTSADQLLWLDSAGNTLTIGEDFRVAEENGLYPVRVYRLIRTIEYNPDVKSFFQVLWEKMASNIKSNNLYENYHYKIKCLQSGCRVNLEREKSSYIDFDGLKNLIFIRPKLIFERDNDLLRRIKTQHYYIGACMSEHFGKSSSSCIILDLDIIERMYDLKLILNESNYHNENFNINNL